MLSTVVVGGTLLAGAGLDTAYQNRILPGVRFHDLSLSGLSEAQVQGLIDVHASTLLSAPVVFVAGDREWHPTATEIGLAVDAPAMAHEAFSLRDGAPAALRLPHAVYLGATHPEVALQTRIDQAQLTAYLNAVAAEVDRAPVNAALQVKGAELVVGGASPGQRLDLDETARRVKAPHDLDEAQRVELAIVPVPPALPDTSTAEAQTVARKVLRAPLTLKAAGRTWTLSTADLGNMLEIKAGPAPDGGERLVATLNEQKVGAYVRTLANQVDRAPLDAELRWNGSSVAVIRESRDGVKLDQADAVRTILGVGVADERELTLKTAVTKPQVASDNLPTLNIQRLMATGSSRFAGSSPERVNNIRVAAGRLNGVVVPAGATFSFLTALGPITTETGYMEGLTIQGDATVPGIGGGVCQVSTTAFRAAFYAGLPIVERHQHTYRVSYYEQDGSPMGFDAAVYSPGVDLKFKNDTGGAILIQTGVDTGSSTVTFRLYGGGTGREVKLAASKTNEVKAGPRLPDGSDATILAGQRKQVEWAADGADATIKRTILQDGQTVGSDSFFSRYTPWREKWVVGTGPGPKPAA